MESTKILKFETIWAHAGGPFTMLRARVPGGWLVMHSNESLAFVPDPKHTWDGGSVPAPKT